jgi:hypothetical protein
MKWISLAIATLALVLVVAPAHAGDGQSSSLDSVDTGSSQDLDDVDTGRSEELEDADTGHSEELEDADTGRSSTMDETGRAWQPPACDGSLPAGWSAPEGADTEGWTLALGQARDRLDRSQRKWRAAETGAAVPRYDTLNPTVQQNQRNEFIRGARDDYAQARCALVGLVAQARRAGVPYGALRAYSSDLPADLQP